MAKCVLSKKAIRRFERELMDLIVAHLETHLEEITARMTDALVEDALLLVDDLVADAKRRT